MSSSLIYHYTNAAGLYGIIESKTIWATDIWFMNDTAEATFSWQQFDSFLRSKKPGSSKEKEAITFALKYMDQIRDIVDGSASCIACFSKHADSLSQWRAYGESGGFSIGFSRSALTRLGSLLKSKPNFTIRNVTYEPGQQERLLESEYLQQITARLDDQESPFGPAYIFICHVAINVLHWLKHPAFREESEVRLHTRGQPDYKVHYRVSEMGITPYIPTPICGKNGRITSIKEIVIGPQRHPTEVMRAVKGFLGNHGLADVQLRQSSAPLRL